MDKIKIIPFLMIKNESRIIRRCIDHLKSVADAIYIYDTGSTDNTIEVCEEVLSGIPYKIDSDPFVNFGVSRSRSFDGCVAFIRSLGWDLSRCFGLAVDADMNLVVGPKWSEFLEKTDATKAGYQLIQKNPNIEYYNMRLMRLSHPWRCVGATHEYWSGDPYDRLGKEYLYIDDRNDGGCKADKFERDERLLLEDLHADPTNARTHFYLAQTYDCLGRKKEAIAYYKKRIAIGGWYEEVWYSHYKIAMIYKELGQPQKMESWVERAYAYNPNRAEAIYMAMIYFINNRCYEKALYYYKKGCTIGYPVNDGLFIEDTIYGGGEFEYWHTIIYYYMYPDSRRKGAEKIINYVNRYPGLIRNSYENLMFHVEPVRGERTFFNFEDKGAFTVGNSSILPMDYGFLMNVRYVDYRVENGAYVWVPEGKVNTRNFFYRMNHDFKPISDLEEVTYRLAEGVKYHPATISGFEDVRLAKKADGSIYFYGSCSNLNSTESIQIVHGICDAAAGECKEIAEIASPQGRHCEKNWCYWPEKDAFIYEWSPYTLYSKGGEGKVLMKKTMPAYFKELRGSTIVMPFRGGFYCLTHQVVMKEGRRNYIHVLVRLDGESGVPIEHTLPFCFEHHGTEYCIGMVLRDEWAYFIYTKDDKNLAMKKVHFDGAFEWIRCIG